MAASVTTVHHIFRPIPFTSTFIRSLQRDWFPISRSRSAAISVAAILLLSPSGARQLATSIEHRLKAWTLSHDRSFAPPAQNRIELAFYPAAIEECSCHGRNRPPVKWSYETSITYFGFTGCHSEDRFVDNRLGPPGAFPAKLWSCLMASSFFVVLAYPWP